MLILNGKNLGERQKDLNMKVKEAIDRKFNTNEVLQTEDESDIGNLFKIDFASKHKMIDYIIEVLKSGDNLCVTRALKCVWIFDDVFSNVINVNNLNLNVFPSMSLKMKKKLLTTAAIYIRNAIRAEEFYKYCIEMQLTNIALKFFIFTSDRFKLKVVQQDSNLLRRIKYKNDFKPIIGSSFALAHAYITTLEMGPQKIFFFYEINYLFSISPIKYLDMLESHISPNDISPDNSTRLGLRISKNILTKYKDRVLRMPFIYLNFLNKTSVRKYSTPKDAKIYIPFLFPADVSEFWGYSYWSGNFAKWYEHIINILPADERFILLKKTFSDKYPDTPFETNTDFYEKHFYKFMTNDVQEKWALNQVIIHKQDVGPNYYFHWYKFVNFETGFQAIKKMILITTDIIKRAEMINILVKSAKTQRDVEKLLKYHHERHNNEQRYIKDNFIQSIIKQHNVYEFDKDCWAAFDKLFLSLGVYNEYEHGSCKCQNILIVLVYAIINNIEVHDALKMYIRTNNYLYALRSVTENLSKEHQHKLFQYLLDFYLKTIKEFDSVPYDDKVQHGVRKYIYFVLDLLDLYDKPKSDVPDVVMKFMKLDSEEFGCHKLLFEQPKKITADDLMRLLKKDAGLVVDSIPVVKKNIEMISYRFHIGQLLKKIRVYFSHDVLKNFVIFFNDLLEDSENIYSKVARAAAFGIFQLDEYNHRIGLMLKYAPTNGKVDRNQISDKMLTIQRAICATAFYSRPPVPLSNIMMYVTGDYVFHCMPMFNYYLVNLPLPLCLQFVEVLLNTPISVQKHGIRLAFSCYSADNLKNLILFTWKKSQNISLRLIIYKALYNKIVQEDQFPPTALLETLTNLTTKLNEDDDHEVFSLMTSGKLPRHYNSEYMSTVWATVKALPKNKQNIQRMRDVLKHMYSNMDSFRRDDIGPIVDGLVKDAFDPEESAENSFEAKSLNEVKWELIANHIANVQNDDELEIKLELTKHILDTCLTQWNTIREDKYVMRSIGLNFLRWLLVQSYLHDLNRSASQDFNVCVNVMFEKVAQMLEVSFPVEDVYMLIWAIQADIAMRQAVYGGNMKLSTLNDEEEKADVIRDVVVNFGKDFGKLMKDYIEKEMYFNCFLPEIEQIFIDKLKNMCSLIIFQTNLDDLLVLASLALMEFKTKEIYLFALNILPSDYSGNYVEDYNFVINELKELNNLEIRCKIFDKFVNFDFKPRSFLQL